MRPLIALFSNNWDYFIKNEYSNQPDLISRSSKYVAHKWAQILEPISTAEIALFQESLLDTQDNYPGTYRRFIHVGSSLEDRIRNLFELCFEKGYTKVLFVETFAAHLSTKSMTNALRALDENDLVFTPTETGTVCMMGMNLEIFPIWSSYDFNTKDCIVEMLTECLEKNISYSIRSVLDQSTTESFFRSEIEKFNEKSVTD